VHLLIFLGLVCLPALAATEYVLVNNNDSVSNTAVLYKLGARTGRLTKVSVLATGGQGQGTEQDLSGVQQAISPDGACIFVFDTGSSDIAAFSKAGGYQKVGNYFDANLIAF